MAQRIDKYRASWHPNANVGLIELQYPGGGHSKIPFDAKSAIEFTAILQLLQGAEKPFVTENGWISTGADDPGDPSA